MTSPNYTYDPVTAIDEAKATGQTAQIFHDIRTTMEIPIVTSIWRGLATMDDSLSKVWTAAKPIYTTGAPLNALNAMPNALELPVPKSLFSPQLQKLGIRPDDLQQIGNIINAYNKSNGMNLMALSALIKFGVPQKTFASPKPTHIPKEPLPELLQKEEIKPATWNLIRQVNALGSEFGIEANVATLWRHLAHWPNVLTLFLQELTPLETNGNLREAIHSVLEYSKTNRITLAENQNNKDIKINIPAKALSTISTYVENPNYVARMVTIGYIVAKWIET